MLPKNDLNASLIFPPPIRQMERSSQFEIETDPPDAFLCLARWKSN